MGFQITLKSGQHSFPAEAGESILDAALRHGLTLPYACRDGLCGSCRGKVLAGQVAHGKASAQALDDDARQAGWALFCCATALSDLTIDCREVRSLADLPVRTFPARVMRLTRAAPDVMIVALKLPASDRLPFFAGQYVDILLKDGKRRAFSLANAPHDDALLQLHIRHIPGGLFTEHVFHGMREGALLRLRGPLGSFFLREESDKPMLLVAGGTAFAPIKAIVEHAIARDTPRAMHIYWGGRGRADLYLRDLAETWAATHAHIRFTPVLSDAAPADAWSGRVGLVHEAAMADHADLSAYQAYVCGSPAMVAAARADFIARCGLPDEEFFADSFDYAGDAGATGTTMKPSDDEVNAHA